MKGTIRTVLLAMLLVVMPSATAHSGGLDSKDCHTNRSTGEYHCHRAPATAPAPARSQFQQSLGRSNAVGATGPGGAFRNCTEARAAGAAPVRRGEPGYGPHLDRDNDGIGCEPYRGR